MQVSVENTGALQRKLTVQVPDEEIQDKVNTKLRELSKQVRIKGFRPGRVPMSVVKQRYGKQVRQDVVTETMQESLQQAIRDEALRPASQPQVDVEPEGLTSGDLEFSAMIEVYPEIAAIDAAALEIDTPESEVTDADVDDMLHTLREQRQSWSPAERTAAAGDQVLLEYSADTDEGRVPEEDTHRLAIIFGDSGFETLEKAVAKIPPGETKSVKLDFPENFREAELAGRKAKVELKVVSVSEPVLPEVDEEFIRSFGIEDGELDSLKVEIRENLERELKQARTSMLKMELIEKLIATTPDLEVPTSLVREEAAMMAAQLASRQGQDEPDPQLVESFMAPAEKRVRGGLLMGELARQNDIRANAAKVRDAIEMVASTYEEPSEVVQLYYSNHRLLQQVETSVMEEQVVDWVLENAKVTPRKMKFQEVISGATQAARTVK